MSKYAISALTILSLLFGLLCLFGFGLALKDQWTKPQKSPSASNPEAAAASGRSSQPLQVVAIGDSLTHGTGDPSGKGYVGIFVGQLKKSTKPPVRLTNVAVSGQRAPQLGSQLKQPNIRQLLKKADIILMTIGGNDLFQGGKTLDHLNDRYIRQSEQDYLANLKAIYAAIRALNQTAVVIHVGLYNPFIELKESRLTSSIITQWNADSEKLAFNYKNIIYVSVFDLFQRNVAQKLADDGFHPNAGGYRLIGDRAASVYISNEEGGK